MIAADLYPGRAYKTNLCHSHPTPRCHIPRCSKQPKYMGRLQEPSSLTSQICSITSPCRYGYRNFSPCSQSPCPISQSRPSDGSPNAHASLKKPQSFSSGLVKRHCLWDLNGPFSLPTPSSLAALKNRSNYSNTQDLPFQACTFRSCVRKMHPFLHQGKPTPVAYHRRCGGYYRRLARSAHHSLAPTNAKHFATQPLTGGRL